MPTTILFFGIYPDFTAIIVEGVIFASIYRAPGTELTRLLSWTPSGPTLIGGDNVLHPE